MTTMNNLPNINLDFSCPESGLVYKVELNLSILLPKIQEMFGIDLSAVVLPLLLRVIR
jgi:hypothetical protein